MNMNDGLFDRVARWSARYAGIDWSEDLSRIVRSVSDEMLDEDPSTTGVYLAHWELSVRTRAWNPVAAYARASGASRQRGRRAIAEHARAIRLLALAPGTP